MKNGVTKMKGPMIESHIEIFPYEKNKTNIFNKDTGKTYLIGEKESGVLKLLDGNHSSYDIEERYPYYTQEEIERLIEEFVKIGLFKKINSDKNILKLKKRIVNPNSFINPKSFGTKMLYKLFIFGCPLMFLFGVLGNAWFMRRSMVLMGIVSEIIGEYLHFGIIDILLLYVLFGGCLFLHEFAHAVTARYYGVNVPEIGVMLYYFMPCAYTNISGINLLKNKNQRLVVLVSGNLVNVGLIGLMYMAIPFASSHVGAYLLALILLNLGTVFMNGMIFLKFDGYYIMEVLVDEIQLKEKSITYFRQLITTVVNRDKSFYRRFKEMRNSQSQYLTNWVYLIYLLLSVTYIPFAIINVASLLVLMA